MHGCTGGRAKGSIKPKHTPNTLCLDTARAPRRLASDDPPTPQHENAAEVLGAIARARACPLTRGLVHPNAITLLARHAFAHGPRPRRVQVPGHISLCKGLGW